MDSFQLAQQVHPRVRQVCVALLGVGGLVIVALTLETANPFSIEWSSAQFADGWDVLYALTTEVMVPLSLLLLSLVGIVAVMLSLVGVAEVPSRLYRRLIVALIGILVWPEFAGQLVSFVSGAVWSMSLESTLVMGPLIVFLLFTFFLGPLLIALWAIDLSAVSQNTD